jgi:hypothetical protein
VESVPQTVFLRSLGACPNSSSGGKRLRSSASSNRRTRASSQYSSPLVGRGRPYSVRNQRSSPLGHELIHRGPRGIALDQAARRDPRTADDPAVHSDSAYDCVLPKYREVFLVIGELNVIRNIADIVLGDVDGQAGLRRYVIDTRFQRRGAHAFEAMRLGADCIDRHARLCRPPLSAPVSELTASEAECRMCAIKSPLSAPSPLALRRRSRHVLEQSAKCRSMRSTSALAASGSLLLAWSFATGCTVSATGSGDSRASQCRIDTDVICPGDFVGYSCQGESKPSPSCGAGTLQSDGEIGYCCGVSPAAACVVDTSVSCTPDASGYSCTGGVRPDATDQSLVCSTGVLGPSADERYCCIGVTGTCAADPNITGCAAGSHGFSCTGADTPARTQTSLVCSSATRGANNELLYCCSLG